jgi:hypothetical protein
VSKETGVSHHAINRGLKDLLEGALTEPSAEDIRKEGGGRKKITDNSPDLIETLKSLVDSSGSGSESPLAWTCKSLRVLTDELNNQGFKVSHPTVGAILEDLGYSLQDNRNVLERSNYLARNAQFMFLNRRILAFIRMKQPVISVDCKKHVLGVNFKNNSREYNKIGEFIKVKDHNFINNNLGKTIPFVIYDLTNNKGYKNVSIGRDTFIFAAQSIRTWWDKMGSLQCPHATRLLITADCGFSNAYCSRLWKYELSKFANETGLKISVCHFPAGTSKWNNIEHRLCSQFTMNWRDQPLTNHEVVVNLIAANKTTTDLKVDCNLDAAQYPAGLKVAEKDFDAIKIIPEKFHGEWNYNLYPLNVVR